MKLLNYKSFAVIVIVAGITCAPTTNAMFLSAVRATARPVVVTMPVRQTTTNAATTINKATEKITRPVSFTTPASRIALSKLHDQKKHEYNFAKYSALFWGSAALSTAIYGLLGLPANPYPVLVGPEDMYVLTSALGLSSAGISFAANKDRKKIQEIEDRLKAVNQNQAAYWYTIPKAETK